MPANKEEGYESLLWENQTWQPVAGPELKSGKKRPVSSTNNISKIDTRKQVFTSKKRRQGEMIKNVGKGGVGEKEDDDDDKVIKEGKSGGGESDDHGMHIWTERERRKKMRNMFSNLLALLPQLPPKADKSTIVDEAVNCIKALQRTLQKLQKQKLERLQSGMNFSTYEPSLMNPQKVVAESSRESFLADQGSSSNLLAITTTKASTSAAKYPVLFQTWTSSNVILNICGDEAQISICSPKKPGLFTTICYVLEKHNVEVVSAHISSDCNRSIYMIQAHASGSSISEAFMVEETYKQVACEIMCWVSS